MEISFDPAKDAKTKAERGFGFEFVALVFEGHVMETIDDRFSYSEIRVKAVGEIDGELFAVVYTDRGDVRHIISARRASRKERREWRT